MDGFMILAAYMTKKIAIDNTIVKFEIWDTAGQERYNSLAPIYYRDASVAMIVFDITDRESLKKAQYWVTELEKKGAPGVILCLVGNKTDLEAERKVSQEEAEAYAKTKGLIFRETSAKTGAHIEEIFNILAGCLPKDTPSRSRPPGIDLSTTTRPSTEDASQCC
jgi:Ras-related protein Rab-5C